MVRELHALVPDEMTFISGDDKAKVNLVKISEIGLVLYGLVKVLKQNS